MAAEPRQGSGQVKEPGWERKETRRIGPPNHGSHECRVSSKHPRLFSNLPGIQIPGGAVSLRVSPEVSPHANSIPPPKVQC